MIRNTATLLMALLALLTPSLVTAQDDTEQVLKGMERLSELLEVIRSNYHDDPAATELVDSAIRGMLGQLDPHSNYISPEQARQLQSQQQGEYYGIGMTVGMRDGKIFCVKPHEGGPADQAGLRAGDVILAIDGESTDAFGYNENVERLRGPQGTTVTITVQRPGQADPRDFIVVRDRVSLKTVPYAFMIDSNTGYIRINNFSHNTHVEMREQVQKLLRRGMEQLVLDLRSNPGGDLDASVAVCDTFLDEGRLVYTKGPEGQQQLEYSAEEETTLFRGPMVVMINSNSASGSEIVAGALQDHDRAWLVGEKSWGKGLVQTQFSLDYGAFLSLTTAKYYTPAGRLIQKPYTPGSFELYFNPEEEEVSQDTLHPAMTDLGRIVYGGNGIMPDQIIKAKRASDSVQEVLGRGLIFTFVNSLMAENLKITDDFYAGQNLMERFRQFLDEKNVDYTDEDWRNDFEFLAARLTLEVHTRGRGAEYGFKQVAQSDSQLQEALKTFGKARELLTRRNAELQ